MDCSLTSLARVLSCLIRVGVIQVSWAVRYLDEPQWRAVHTKDELKVESPVLPQKRKHEHRAFFGIFWCGVVAIEPLEEIKKKLEISQKFHKIP